MAEALHQARFVSAIEAVSLGAREGVEQDFRAERLRGLRQDHTLAGNGPQDQLPLDLLDGHVLEARQRRLQTVEPRADRIGALRVLLLGQAVVAAATTRDEEQRGREQERAAHGVTVPAWPSGYA